MNAVIMRFTLLGPAIGTITFNAVDVLLTRPAQIYPSRAMSVIVHVASAAFGGLMRGALGLFMGFPLGLLPAFAAGAIYWLVLRSPVVFKRTVASRVLVGSVAGLSVATLFGGLFFSHDASGQWIRNLTICWSGAGLLSGALCGVVIGEASFAVSQNGRA